MKLRTMAAAAALATIGGLGLAATPALAQTPPVVTSVSPSGGPAAGGNSVVIDGAGFIGVTSIAFGANPSPSFTCLSDGSACTALAPPGHGLEAVRVTTALGGTSLAVGNSEYLYSLAAVTVQDRLSGLYVDALGPNGTHVTQQPLLGSAAEAWVFESDGTIRADNGKCLDVTAVSVVNGAKLQLWTCNGQANQKWRVHHVGGFFEIVSRNSGKCVDDTGLSLAAGTQFQQWTCNNEDQQQFSL